MRSKLLVTLIAVLVLVTAYFFLIEQRGRRRSEEVRLSSRVMLPYGPKDVDRVWLLNPYGDTIGMERSGDRWMITWPVTDDGDDPAIDMLLWQIVPGQKLAEYPAVERLSDYGLDAPYATLIVESTRYGRTDTIHIGDKTPTSFRAYARLGDSRTVVVTRDLAHNVMQKTLFHLRDKNFIHLPPGAVTRVVVRSPGSRIEFVRSGSEWLLGGSALRADRTLVEPYVRRLLDAVVYEFPAENPADTARFGIGDPPRELFLYAEGGVTRISFGSRDGEYVPVMRTGRGKVMMIESQFLDPFTWVRDHVLVMSLSTVRPGDVAALAWDSPDTTLSLAFSGGKWRSSGPSPVPVDGESVKYLLMLLRSTRFESLIDGPAEAASAFEHTRSTRIMLIGSGGETLDVIRLARPSGGKPVGASLTVGNAGILARGSIDEIERAFRSIGIH